MSKPASSASRALRTNCASTASMSARDISRGTWLTPSRYGSADGAISGQLRPPFVWAVIAPSSIGQSIRSQPTCVEPLRPAWPICMHSFACEFAWTKSASRANASRCVSFQSPVHPGVIRPSADTQVISTNTSPAPPSAREP